MTISVIPVFDKPLHIYPDTVDSFFKAQKLNGIGYVWVSRRLPDEVNTLSEPAYRVSIVPDDTLIHYVDNYFSLLQVREVHLQLQPLDNKRHGFYMRLDYVDRNKESNVYLLWTYTSMPIWSHRSVA